MGSEVEMEPRGTALVLGTGLDRGWAVVPSDEEIDGVVEPGRSVTVAVFDSSEPSEPWVDWVPSPASVVSEPIVLLTSESSVVSKFDPSVLLQSGPGVVGSTVPG